MRIEQLELMNFRNYSKLNIKFNRIRQGIITQEISEIVGGSEAQK